MSFRLPDALRSERAVLTLVTALGLTIRLIGVTREPLWKDELLTIAYVNGGTILDILTYAHYTDPHPPTYYLLMKFWFSFVPQTPFTARLPSVLAATAAIPVLYYAGKELGSPQYGSYIAAFAAVAPPLVFYAQQARMYGFVTLFMALSLYTLLRYLDTPTRRNALMLTGAMLGVALFHVYGFFTIVTVNLIVFDARYTGILADADIDITTWLATQVGLGVLLAPWVAFIILTKLLSPSGAPAGLEWLPNSSPFAVPFILLQWFVYLGADHAPVQAVAFREKLTVLLGLPVLVLYFLLVASDTPPRLRVLAAWTLLPFVFSYLFSWALFPIAFVRYYVQVGIGLCVLVGSILALVSASKTRRRIAFVIFALTLLPSHTLLYAVENPAWDSVITSIQDEEQTTVIAIGNDSGAAYAFYGSDDDRVVQLDKTPTEAAVNTTRPPPERTFWVLYLDDADSAVATDVYNQTHQVTERKREGRVTAVRYAPTA